MPAPRRPRLLCLHGGGSNNDITRFQTSGLKLGDRFECVYLHAPHVANSSYPGLALFSSGPWYHWGSLASGRAGPWQESLEHLADFCERNGPFDGVYAFSQGTAIITNFSHPSVWKERFRMKKCPWKFAILACGGASAQVDLPGGSVVGMPSFHIFGKKDGHLTDSQIVASYWDPSQSETHTHGRGHEIDVRMWSREQELIAKLETFLDEKFGRA